MSAMLVTGGWLFVRPSDRFTQKRFIGLALLVILLCFGLSMLWGYTA